MVCEKCNHEYPDEFDKCPVCGEPNPGARTEDAPSGAPAQPQYIGQANTEPVIPKWKDSSENRENEPERARASEPIPPNRLYPAVQQAPEERKGVVAPLVCGILSLSFPVVGIVLGILALVMGSSAKKCYAKGSAEYSMAQVGWILGLIGLILQVILIIYLCVVFGMLMKIIQLGMSNAFDSYGYYGEYNPYSDWVPFFSSGAQFMPQYWAG